LSAIQFNAITKSFGAVRALDKLSFGLQANEFFCIVGPSGCGKSTLLRLAAGLVAPSSGTIHFDSQEKPRTALVFQDHGLLPWLKVIDNVAFGLEMQGVAKRERHRRAGALIEQFGLRDFGNHYPHQLSGGMRQRVGIARALLSDPHILLMDEPFGALDAQTRLVLQAELLRLWSEQRKTVLYVTHDIDEAIVLGDRVLVMTGRPGRVRDIIPIHLPRPRDLSVTASQEFLEIKQKIWSQLQDEVRQSLQLTS